MRRHLFGTLLASLVALTAFAAYADNPKKKKAEPLPTDPAELHKLLDTDPADKPDGKLSLDEFLALEPKLPVTKKSKAAPPDLKNIFNIMDRNADGVLTPFELKTIGTLVELTAPKKKK
jgi:Ca2+-binding EF-hand superfamily protein